VAKRGAKLVERNLKDLKIITCHLGNGSSMAAIDCGKSIDTTMGFTPLEGLMMGTRCGDLDPAIPMFLQRNENLNHNEVDAILNKQSGIKGISELSSDMRDIEKAVDEGNEQAILAQDVFTYRIKKYIGAYMAAMNGTDLIIFTAGVGERDRMVRRKVLENMEFMGITFNPVANEEAFGRFGEISGKDSKVKVLVIPTNEELEIAEQTVAVVRKKLA
jgi:acetate kinase